jgi:hypothetical protein
LVGECKYSSFSTPVPAGGGWETKEVPACEISRKSTATDEALPIYLIVGALKSPMKESWTGIVTLARRLSNI